MDVFIYKGDIYCEGCGNDIREQIEISGPAPTDIDGSRKHYDSDEYPKGPYPDGGGEADSPQHCGNHGKCISAIDIPGHVVGAFLENPLTSDGEQYAKDAIAEGGEVSKIWAEYYSYLAD